jgi:hypothetical protein
MATHIILLIMGIALFYIILKSSSARRHLKKQGLTTEGIIVGSVASAKKNDNTLYPIVRFTTNNNAQITVTSKEGYLPGRIKKGKRLIVLYNPSNTNEFVLALPKEAMMNNILLIASVVFSLASLVLILNDLQVIHLFKK